MREATILLELALWKANIDDNNEGGALEEGNTKKVKIDVDAARQEKRITSGADIITVRNVLSFLQLQ